MKRALLGLSLGSVFSIGAFANAPVATINADGSAPASASVITVSSAAPVTTAAPTPVTAAPANSAPATPSSAPTATVDTLSAPQPLASDNTADSTAPQGPTDATDPTDASVPQVVNSQAMIASLTPEQRLERLENQVAYLNTYGTQINSLTAQIDALRGQVESLTYQVNSLKQQLAAASPNQVAASSQTVTQALNNANSSTPQAASSATSTTAATTTTAAAASALSTNQPVSATPPAPPTPQEQSAYQAAYNLMLQKQYAQSVTAFNNFLTQYPQSSLATMSHYWLGDLYLAQGQPDDASQQYRMVVNDTTATKRPDAMLKLGTILLAYGDSAHAKQLFQALIQQYPNTDAANQAQARLKNM